MFGLYIIAAWLFVGAVVLVILYHRKTFKMTSTATCEVIRAEEREVRTERERRDETLVVCRYVAWGNEFTIERVFRGRQAERFRAGTKLPIRYNPADPSMSRIDVR